MAGGIYDINFFPLPMHCAIFGRDLGKDLKIEYQNDPNSGHYQITPYAFMPKIGRKLTPPLTVDLGQGILRVMEAEHRQIHNDAMQEEDIIIKE